MEARKIKSKKDCSVIHPQLNNPGQAGPATFFLRSERDLERAIVPRGRKMSRAISDMDGEATTTPLAISRTMGDSNFGVESLTDTINSAFSSETDLSRTDSNKSFEGGGNESNILAGRKRKAGNLVHPTIRAVGRRILSSDCTSPHVSSTASPISLRSSESPFRTRHRRGSASSSINFASEPMTPLKMSPHPESAMPSTPRSGSPKSFRLSDEESSVADETGSQAIQSSNSDEDEELACDGDKSNSMPQLVMPSIAIPTRRPVTERGRRMGRLRVLVVGHDGAGKTSLIKNICRLCEDIVHVDSPTASTTFGSDPNVLETYISTRTYPTWWTEFESRRMLLRRKSVGAGVLERNLCFIDMPGINQESNMHRISRYFDLWHQKMARLDHMTDSEFIHVLSGDGGVQIDAVLYMLHPRRVEGSPELFLPEQEKSLLQKLCQYANVIPLIGHSDSTTEVEMAQHKKRFSDFAEDARIETYSFDTFACSPNDSIETASCRPRPPFAISSALMDDAEEVDASVLMSSQYIPPLVPSELAYLVDQLLDPDNIARMRHLSAVKFVLWRQHNLGTNINIPRQNLLHSPQFGHTIPSITSTGSALEAPSNIILPHSTSSYYRSTSPCASDSSALSGSGIGTSAYALLHCDGHTAGEQPFRQVRLAKWAQDLQRSLQNERKRYQQMYAQVPPEWTSPTNSDNEKALIFTPSVDLPSHKAARPARGRLGGEIAIIDPRDPLGVLAFTQAFRRRGWLALQLAGGLGVLSAATWWVMRNWVEVQEWLALSGPSVLSSPAVPAPTKGVFGEMEDILGKFLGIR